MPDRPRLLAFGGPALVLVAAVLGASWLGGGGGALAGGAIGLALAYAALLGGLRAAERRERARAVELRALEQRLELSRAELERQSLLFASMREGVLVLGRDRAILSANPAAREMFELSGDARGRALIETIRDTALVEAAEKALSGDGPQERDLRLERPGASERALTLRVVPFPAAGPPIGAIAVLQDVTSLQQLERVRRDFVANVSHEFRTPLTAVRGFAETLERPDLSTDKRLEFARIILRHTDRLERLLEDLLVLAEIEAGRRMVEPEPADPVGAAQEILVQLAPRLEERRAHGSVARLGDEQLYAFVDRRALDHVLLNLIDNAAKYSPDGGEVRVEVAPAGSRVEVRVIDTGIGIPSKELPRIFERFYRVERGRERSIGGSGLGLAIVKHLSELMGGEVRVTSEVGRGSAFTVSLPRHPGPAAEA